MKKVEEYLLGLGLRVWEKGNHRRIYINDLKVVGLLEVEKHNPKAFRRESMYYDCIKEKFVYNVSRSAVSTMEDLIAYIEKKAEEIEEEIEGETEEAAEEETEEIINEEVREIKKTITSIFDRAVGEIVKDENKTYRVVSCIQDPDYDDLFITELEPVKEEVK